MDQRIFFQVVAPLMGVDGTAVLAISSPENEDNYYSELLNLGIFRVIYLGKGCKACEESGVTCTHIKPRLPQWKPQSRQNMLESMYKDKALFERENNGRINSSKDYIFKKLWVRAFSTRQPYLFEYNCQVLHCAIDPAAGAESSDFTIGTMAYENSHKALVGMDHVCTSEYNGVVEMIETHLQRLREDPRYRSAVIYIYIEANLSFITAGQIRDICQQQQYYPVVVKSYDASKEQRVGVWTGAEEKQMYAIELKRALADGALVYADKFVSTDPDIKTEVREQLEMYRREVKISGTGKKTIEYSGKTSSKKDDICIVIQMLLYWSRITRETIEYQQAAEANGWRL